MAITRLNHAVLYVRDATASAAFYRDVLDFRIVVDMGGQAVFLRADGSENDHDLGLFSIGDQPRSQNRGIGLYHLAWQVHTIDELVALRARLVAAGALVGQSDHGASLSLYARDIDGLEFEVMWARPRDQWPDTPGTAHLDLDAALDRWAGVDTAR